jgi:hypothetical protein
MLRQVAEPKTFVVSLKQHKDADPASTEWNLMWSAMCSAPGMPPGTAMRSQSLGAPRPATRGFYTRPLYRLT